MDKVAASGTSLAYEGRYWGSTVLGNLPVRVVRYRSADQGLAAMVLYSPEERLKWVSCLKSDVGLYDPGKIFDFKFLDPASGPDGEGLPYDPSRNIALKINLHSHDEPTKTWVVFKKEEFTKVDGLYHQVIKATTCELKPAPTGLQVLIAQLKERASAGKGDELTADFKNFDKELTSTCGDLVHLLPANLGHFQPKLNEVLDALHGSSDANKDVITSFQATLGSFAAFQKQQEQHVIEKFAWDAQHTKAGGSIAWKADQDLSFKLEAEGTVLNTTVAGTYQILCSDAAYNTHAYFLKVNGNGISSNYSTPVPNDIYSFSYFLDLKAGDKIQFFTTQPMRAAEPPRIVVSKLI